MEFTSGARCRIKNERDYPDFAGFGKRFEMRLVQSYECDTPYIIVCIDADAWDERGENIWWYLPLDCLEPLTPSREERIEGWIDAYEYYLTTSNLIVNGIQRNDRAALFAILDAVMPDE